MAAGEERLSSRQQRPPLPCLAVPTGRRPHEGSWFVGLGAKAVSGEGWAGGHLGAPPGWRGHTVPSGGPAPCPGGHLELQQAWRRGLGSRVGAGGPAVRACVGLSPECSVLVGALLAAGLEVIVRRPSPRVFTGNPISLEELHIKARPRLMSRGLGGQQAGGSVPVCDLWSPWHWVPGEDCDRSSLWRSGVLCFPEAWGH